MKRGFVLVLFAVLVFSSPLRSYAGNSWNTDQKGFDRNPVVEIATASGNLNVQWTKSPTLNMFEMPVYSDGIFYFSEKTNEVYGGTWTVYAISRTTGAELWRKVGNGSLPCSPVLVGGNILIPGENLILADAKSGMEIWHKESYKGSNYSYLFSDPIVQGDKIIVMQKYQNSGYLQSLNLVDGSLNWYKRLTVYGYQPLSLYKNNVILTTSTTSNYTVIDSYRIIDGNKNWTYSSYLNPGGSVVVDEDHGIGLLNFPAGSGMTLDLISGTKREASFGYGTNTTRPIFKNGKVYFLSYYNRSTYYSVCDYIKGECSLHKKIADGLIYEYRVFPILVGDSLYFGGNSGKFFEVNIGDGEFKFYQVGDEETVLFSCMYADGSFILADYYFKKLFVLGDGTEPVETKSWIELDSPYKTDGEYNAYLGQLHSHYIPDVAGWSDLVNGDPTPAFTENKYKEAGYDFVALTEHNQIVTNPGVDGIMHLVDSEEDTQGHFGNHVLAVGIQNTIDETLDDQARINSIVDQGGIPILAHPNSYWYEIPIKSLLKLSGYQAIEVFNNGVDKAGKYLDLPSKENYNPYDNSYALDKWDALLSSGKKVYAAAGDDFTPGDPGFDGGSVMVFAKTNGQEDIFNNLKSSNFYVLQGSGAPRINVSTSGNNITASSDRESTIRFISKGRTIKEILGVSSSTYTANGLEDYIRIEVEAEGKKAWSQPIFVNLNVDAQTPFPGQFKIDLGKDNVLDTHNISSVIAKTLSPNEYPANSPQLGYLSPVYYFSSASAPSSGTELKLSYKDQPVLTNEDNLSIYYFNEAVGNWEKVSSVVDKTNKTVSAALAHFSLYTLSAEEPEDNILPSISLADPNQLDNLAGNTVLTVSASDNNAVIKASLYVDNNLIAEDYDSTDAWTLSFDSNNYANGEHIISLTAEDLSGNIGQRDYTFNITNSSFLVPEITLYSPGESGGLWDLSEVTGEFSSILPTESVSVYIDDYFIKEAKISDNTFLESINWSEYKEGTHILKVILVDTNGNRAVVGRNIAIGENAKGEIISLKEDIYFQSDKIGFSYTANKSGVTAKLDDNIIENGTEKYGYEIGLGQHDFTLEYKGKMIAEKKFTITTSINDLQKLITLFYEKGAFKNRGIYTSIQANLATAERFEESGRIILRNTTLAQLIKYVERQSGLSHMDNSEGRSIIGSIKLLLLFE